jgi:cytochrome c-type biogenesis protein CcmE
MSEARGRNRWFAVGALTVAAAALLVVTLGGIGKNLVYYWGPTELRGAGDSAVGASIRLGGLVAPGSIVRGEGASHLEFDVIDRQGASVHVKATGIPPQMFRERIGVVVEGTLTRAGYFQGNRLMVSHGNEYRAPGEGAKADVKALMRTTQGLEAEGKAPKP